MTKLMNRPVFIDVKHKFETSWVVNAITLQNMNPIRDWLPTSELCNTHKYEQDYFYHLLTIWG